MGLRGPNPRQEISSPGPHRANRLEYNNKRSAPVTLMTQRELPGIRKPAAVRKNEFTHFLRPDAGFRCALCAQHASEAGCPGAMECVIQVAAGNCSFSKSCRIRHSRVQGGAPLPGGVWGKAPTQPFPRQISVLRALIRRKHQNFPFSLAQVLCSAMVSITSQCSAILPFSTRHRS